MSNEGTSVAIVTEENKQIARAAAFSLAPRTLGEAIEFAKIMANSDLVPKDFREKPGNVLVAVQMGAEVGLAPMQAIQNIAVINGRPAMWGDACLALVKASGLLAMIDEVDDGSQATCTVQRRGEPNAVSRSFSMDDAKTAGLLSKDGPWKTYPKRMRQMRARAWALRDAFPDVLKGLAIREEAEDTTAAATERPPIEPPRRKSEQAADVEAEVATAGGAVEARIANVETVKGTTNGKAWTYYAITTEDGDTFSTFHKSHREAAEAAAASHDPVRITWEPTKKGGKEMTAIEAIEQSADEPSQQGADAAA